MSTKVRGSQVVPEFGQGRLTGIRRNFSEYFQAFPASFAERRALLLLGDTLALLLAVFVAVLFWRSMQSTASNTAASIGLGWYWFAVFLAGWFIVAWFMDLYHVPSACDRREVALRMSLIGLANLALCLVIFLVVPPDLPRVFFAHAILVAWIAILAWRWVYAVALSTSFLQHRILIVGNGQGAHDIASLLEESPALNCRVIAYYGEDERTTSDPGRGSVQSWTLTHSLSDLARQLQIHEVVIATDGVLEHKLFSQAAECQANGIEVSTMPDFMEKICRKTPIQYIEPGWAMQALQGQPLFNHMQLGLKRLLDLVLALPGLVVLVASLPFLAIAIRLDSAGPIFYRQTRCGRAGKPFCIIKFRTMVQDAEKDGKPRWAAEGDSRITRLGRLLRTTHLDELPQVINVLRGEMSIVGPRPERPEFVQKLQQDIPLYFSRLMVKPGLTGWAQTQYRYGNSADDALVKLQYDFYYLRNWSIWLDLHIIFHTFAAVVARKGT